MSFQLPPLPPVTMSFQKEQQQKPRFDPATYDPVAYDPMLDDDPEEDTFVSLENVENVVAMMSVHDNPFAHHNFAQGEDVANNGEVTDCTESTTTNGSVYGGQSATTNGTVCGGFRPSKPSKLREQQRQQRQQKLQQQQQLEQQQLLQQQLEQQQQLELEQQQQEHEQEQQEHEQEQQQPQVFMEGEMSRSEEEEHKVLAQLEKLEAYVLPNDENAEPFDADAVSPETLQDEEFSLHLSRPTDTGTGSEQLELWIREVNLAVSKKRHFHPHLSIETGDRMVGTSSPDGPQSRSVLSPSIRNDISPSKRNERVAFSPACNQNSYKHFSLDQNLDKRPRSPKWPGSFPANGMQKTNLSSPAPSSAVQDSEIMASIEGKYKSLRDDLIRDPTFDEENNDDIDRETHVRDENEEESISYSASHPSKRSTQNTRVPTTTSLAAYLPSRAAPSLAAYLPSRAAPRIDFSARDNNFSLGMLSTRSSGILSPNNSYDSSGSSFQSTLSGLSSYPEGRGCGNFFLCD